MQYSLYSAGVNRSSHELGKFNAPSLNDAFKEFTKILKEMGFSDEEIVCSTGKDDESFTIKLPWNDHERLTETFQKLANIADHRGDPPYQYFIVDHNMDDDTISYVKTAWYAD
jgi:hypothetical protein